MIEKIAREVTPRGSFTVIYFSVAGEIRVQRFPTSEIEHARIRQIFKQDRYHPEIHNEFSTFRLTSC